MWWCPCRVLRTAARGPRCHVPTAPPHPQPPVTRLAGFAVAHKAAASLRLLQRTGRPGPKSALRQRTSSNSLYMCRSPTPAPPFLSHPQIQAALGFPIGRGRSLGAERDHSHLGLQRRTSSNRGTRFPSEKRKKSRWSTRSGQGGPEPMAETRRSRPRVARRATAGSNAAEQAGTGRGARCTSAPGSALRHKQPDLRSAWSTRGVGGGRKARTPPSQPPPATRRFLLPWTPPGFPIGSD